jgi:hypothetical protein
VEEQEGKKKKRRKEEKVKIKKSILENGLAQCILINTVEGIGIVWERVFMTSKRCWSNPLPKQNR